MGFDFLSSAETMTEQDSFMAAVMDLNLGLCNAMLPLTLRTSTKVIAVNIKSARDVLQQRCTKCQSWD